VAEQLEKQLAEKRTHYPAARLHIVLGVVNDKDVDTILGYMPQGASYYFTEPATSRALSANDLMARWRAIHPSDLEHVYSYAKAMDALSAAQTNANAEDIIFVGGSNYLVGEILSHVDEGDVEKCGKM
jgi:dihydrofolate synthase/folylpolyglutamate synthase